MRFESLPPAPIISIARWPDASELWRQARGDSCYGKGAFRRRSIGRGEHQYQRDLSIKDVSKAHRDLEARKAPRLHQDAPVEAVAPTLPDAQRVAEDLG